MITRAQKDVPAQAFHWLGLANIPPQASRLQLAFVSWYRDQPDPSIAIQRAQSQDILNLRPDIDHLRVLVHQEYLLRGPGATELMKDVDRAERVVNTAAECAKYHHYRRFDNIQGFLQIRTVLVLYLGKLDSIV